MRISKYFVWAGLWSDNVVGTLVRYMESDELNERVKRRVYIPEDEDEYDAASKPLTGESIFVYNVYHRILRYNTWLQWKRGLLCV